MSIWVKICKYVDFGKKKFQIPRYLSKSSKISNLVKIVEKSQIWSNLSKNLDFSLTCRKFSILVKIFKNVDLIKISINVDSSQHYQKNEKDLNFGQNF